VWLKLENLQVTGAFKIRGCLNRVMSLTQEDRDRGLIAASSGNHALGLSLAGSLTGAAVTVVMPRSAPTVKVNGCRRLGAQVLLEGSTYDDAYAHGRKLALEGGLTYVESFDDPLIVAGQGTIALEIFEDLPDVDGLICPIGGGGLVSGLLAARAGGNWGGTRVIGVEAHLAPGMKESLAAGRAVTLPGAPTKADGIAVRKVGDLTFSIAKGHIDDVVVVTDSEMLEATGYLMTKHKVVAELAGAAPVAALLAGRISLQGMERVVCVVTGGNIGSDTMIQALTAYEERES